MEKVISRQHSETEIPEIVGKTCDSILAVGGSIIGNILIFYVSLGGMWLRIFLDAGALFVDVCEGPDPEDDLDDGEKYLDLITIYGLKKEEISVASMKDGVFRLGFKSGVEMHFKQKGEETELRIIK